jgi:hypothetical protein
MKNLKVILSVILAFVACLAITHYIGAETGASLAMMIPLMPKNLFSSRGAINRAIRLDDGTWGEGGETLHYPVYDRMRMLNAQATNTRSLFKSAVGTTREGNALTFADTNIEKSESVPSSQKWTFWKFTCQYQAIAVRTDAQIQNILDYFRTTTIRCVINSKDDMFRLPLWKFMGHMQLISAPAVTVNSRFPQSIFTGSFEMKIPIVLQSLTDWEVKIEPLVASAAALDNDFIGFEFDGERDRKN